MARGYMGKILMVDLSKKELKDEVLDEKLCRQFIGGYGIGARIIYSRQKAHVDPLGPDNIFGVVTGPLTGTPAIAASRYTVVGKSPLTRGWGDANSGGHFGPHMKFAGYDGVFFTGISDKPVYLLMNNGQAELRDAVRLWGKDSSETEDILKSELGKDAEIACIGPSGETLSFIAAVMNHKGRAAARSGLGAVMGSKKLKAVAVKGSMKIPLADEDRAKELRKECLRKLGGPSEIMKLIGTPSITVRCCESGDTPTKNWGGTAVIDFRDYGLIGGDPVIKLEAKKYACYQCPIGCGGQMRAGKEYPYAEGVHKPEYETLATFGSMCLNSNLESIIMANDICNRYGLDTMSAGSTIAFAIECYENGMITKADTEGIELTWGNHKSIIAMTEKMAKREGFGNVLADGVKVAAEKIGKGSEQYAIHIQGQEMSMHDPKFATELVVTYRLDATPARHTQGSEKRHPPGLLPNFDPKSVSGRGEAHKIGSNFNHVVNCAGLCAFGYGSLPTVDAVADFLRAVTGWEVTLDELLKAGERISNLRHAFNLREGLNPLEFRVPDRVLGKPPQKEGPLAGVSVDEDTLIKEYIALMDWDPKTARPSKKKLQELGLEDVARELWP